MGQRLRRRVLAFMLVLAATACGGSDTSDLEARIAELETELAQARTATTTAAPPATPGSTPDTTTTTTTTRAPTTTRRPTTTTTTVPLQPHHITIDLFITESQCFGTAGGLVTAETDVSLLPGSWEGRWLVVFEVSNVEDGPETHSIELDMNARTAEVETLILQTEDCDDDPTVTVTAVRER